MKTMKGKKYSNLTNSRAAGLRSNKKGCPKGSKTPGPNYGHGKIVKKAPSKVW